jgi:hypothetical protein
MLRTIPMEAGSARTIRTLGELRRSRSSKTSQFGTFANYTRSTVVGWRRVTRRQWQLLNERGQLLRTVMAREPYFNESKRPRYVVMGDGYSSTTHESLRAAQAAAVKSLASRMGEQQAVTSVR